MAKLELEIVINLDNNEQRERFVKSIKKLNLDLRFKIIDMSPNGWHMYLFKGSKSSIKILNYLYHSNLV